MARRKRVRRKRTRRTEFPRGGYAVRMRLFGKVYLYYLTDRGPLVQGEVPESQNFSARQGFGWRRWNMRSNRGE